MKLTMLPKSKRGKFLLIILVAGILLTLYHRGERADVDLRSARVRHSHSIYGIPVSRKIEETEFSKMLAEAGMPEEPPHWKLITEITYSAVGPCRGCNMWGGGAAGFARDMALNLRMIEEHYRKTGDEALNIQGELKKRMLRFFVERMSAEEGNIWEGIPQDMPPENWKEFIERFREKTEEPKT